MEAFTALYAAVESFPTPYVCVCTGHCVGAGAEIAAGCDLRVVADNAKLAWSGALLGVPVGPARLSPLVGHARAKELIFTGRPIDCAEANALGLGSGARPRSGRGRSGRARPRARPRPSPARRPAAPEAHVLRLRRHAGPGGAGERRAEPLAAARSRPAVRTTRIAPYGTKRPCRWNSALPFVVAAWSSAPPSKTSTLFSSQIAARPPSPHRAPSR